MGSLQSAASTSVRSSMIAVMRSSIRSISRRSPPNRPRAPEAAFGVSFCAGAAGLILPRDLSHCW